MKRLNPEVARRWGVTLVVGLLLVATQVAPLRRIVYQNPLVGRVDTLALEQVDEAFDRALVAFALARVTNAAISFLQETEVEITPLGVGVTLAVGEVLDPINDLVERFSWVMLVSLTSLGIQKVLLEAGPWLSVEMILAAALALLLAGLWWPRTWRFEPAWLGRRLLVLALLVRFCVPFAAFLNQQTYRIFLAERYTVATGEIEDGSREMSAVQKKLLVTPREGQQGRPGTLEQAQKLYGQLAETLNVREGIESLKEKANAMLHNFLALTVVFLLNTVLFPVLFLWGGVRLVGVVLERGARVERPPSSQHDSDKKNRPLTQA